MANERLDGAVVISAPVAATVTLMLALAPSESVITIVAVPPVVPPLITKVAPLAVEGVATAVLLLEIW